MRRFIGLLNYYRRFIPHCAATLDPLTDLLRSKARPIELCPAAHSAFETAKKALADAILLHHLSSDPPAQLILTTDASNCAVGAVLHEQVNNQLQPLAFFSQKLQPVQTRYSTFSLELLAIYLAIRHFRHLLEGSDFSVHNDRKPHTYALKAKPDRYSPREVSHLDFMSQFTADIRYVRGSDNVVADALSRPDINTLTSDFDLAKIADLQSDDKSIDDLRSTTTLQLRDAPLPASPGTILCDWSTGTPRPAVPLSYRMTVVGSACTPKNKSQPITGGHVRFLYCAVILIVAPPHWIFLSALIDLHIRIIDRLVWNVLPEGHWAERR
ncbi:hypothetical protein SprV_0200821400 [Sparganum proliferum]